MTDLRKQVGIASGKADPWWQWRASLSLEHVMESRWGMHWTQDGELPIWRCQQSARQRQMSSYSRRKSHLFRFNSLSWLWYQYWWMMESLDLIVLHRQLWVWLQDARHIINLGAGTACVFLNCACRIWQVVRMGRCGAHKLTDMFLLGRQERTSRTRFGMLQETLEFLGRAAAGRRRFDDRGARLCFKLLHYWRLARLLDNAGAGLQALAARAVHHILRGRRHLGDLRQLLFDVFVTLAGRGDDVLWGFSLIERHFEALDSSLNYTKTFWVDFASLRLFQLFLLFFFYLF